MIVDTLYASSIVATHDKSIRDDVSFGHVATHDKSIRDDVSFGHVAARVSL